VRGIWIIIFVSSSMTVLLTLATQSSSDVDVSDVDSTPLGV